VSWQVTLADQVFEIGVDSVSGSQFTLSIDGEQVEVDACFPEAGALHLILDGEAFEFDIQKTEEGQDVTLYGTRYSARVLDERSRALLALGIGGGPASGHETISTSMPGKVVSILVEEGQEVRPGDGIIVVEAMKMENELRCAGEGVVESILVATGDAVVGGTALVKIKPKEDA
jgi:biotin carboxyl carrier protein